MSDLYFDVYYREGSNPSFCYRSGELVYEEILYNGALVTSGWNTAGYPLDVLTNCPTHLDRRFYTEPYSFNIELDGQSIDYDLDFVSFDTEKTNDNIHAVLTLKSRIKPVLLRVHTVLDGSQMFTRYIEIVNLGEANINISRMSVISGGVEDMDVEKLTDSRETEKYYSLGFFADDRWGREGEFVWRDLQTDVTSIDSRFNRDRFRHPLIFIRNNVMGKMWFAQIGWSGGCRFTLDYNAKAETASTHLAFKAEILAHNPMYILPAGDCFTTPEVHIGAVCGDFDEAVNQMHLHTRRSVLKADDKTLLVGGGMGAEHDMSVETSKCFADRLAKMGAEVFIVDAGWACPPGEEMRWGEYNGINFDHPERYPNGLVEIADYCHSIGIKFGLWVDIDSIGKLVPLYNEYPEYRALNTLCERSSNFLDYSRPEVEKTAYDALVRIITDYKIDLLRIDCNVDYKDYFGVRDTGYGVKECTSLKHFEAIYRIFNNLREKFPDIIFENCAGGGGRTDLGMMKSFNHTWVSDCQCAPHSLYITNGMTMALPPERVDRLFAGMGCHSFGSFALQMRNTMLTHMSLNVIAPAAAQMNIKQLEFVKHSTDIYKSFIRPFLPESRIYHHTPDTKEAVKKGYMALEVTSADKLHGAAVVYTMTMSNNEYINICLKGVDRSKSYKVTLDNDNETFILSGAELAGQGIRLNPSSPLLSELVLYEAL